MIATSDALYRKTTSTWVFPNIVPYAVIRYIQIVLPAMCNIYIHTVHCVAGELTVILTTADGSVVASTKTKLTNTLVECTIHNRSLCSAAYVYTGALAQDYSVVFEENKKPLLIGAAVVIATNYVSAMNSITINGIKTTLTADLEIDLDPLYYTGELLNDVLTVSLSDVGRTLTETDITYIDTIDCIMSINNVEPDSTGNLNIVIKNTNKTVADDNALSITENAYFSNEPTDDNNSDTEQEESSDDFDLDLDPDYGTYSLRNSAAEKVYDTVVCYIDTTDSFIAMCALDEPEYMTNAFSLQARDKWLSDCLVYDEEAGKEVFDRTIVEDPNKLYEEDITGIGLPLYAVNPDCDANPIVAHVVKCIPPTKE